MMNAQDTASEPMSHEDYEKEFPLTDKPHTCSKCKKVWSKEEFLALPVPEGWKREWEWPGTIVKLAVRPCTCGHSIARRVA